MTTARTDRPEVEGRPRPGRTAEVRPSWTTHLDERFSGLSILLIVADVVALACAAVDLWPAAHWALLLAAAQLVSRANSRVYRRRLRLSYFDDLPRVATATAVGVGLASAAAFLFDGAVLISMTSLRGLGIFLLVSEALRALVIHVARWARRRLGRGERTVVIGATELGADLVRIMIEHPDFGLRPIGFVDSSPMLPQICLPLPVLGGDVARVISEHRVQTVLVSFAGSRDADLVDIALAAHRLGASMLVVPRLYELYHDAADVERLRSYPLVRMTSDPTRRPTWLVKRALDAVFGLVGLLAVSPILLACSAAILIESGRPILFRQERIGMNGKPFAIYKLRSLKPATGGEEQTTWSIAGDPRVGPVGRFLRRTSLDELPQLWNIVRGDMALVGPRPERPGFVERFSTEHARYWARHRVPSGLTGLAQVSGLRGNTSIADRARYDNYYIANWTLWLDLKILLLTLRELLRKGEH